MQTHVKMTACSMAVVFGGAVTAALGQKAAVPDASLRPVLVELFTSEGCSSCPPADELLRKLAGKRTDAGQMIVVLSEHVTYWNQLGWVDPFSSETFTQRQEIYGERFNLDGVYTPQAVVNGERQMPGGDAAAIVQAVQTQKSGSANALRILRAVAGPGTVVVTFSALGSMAKAPTSLYAAVADDMDTSNVTRGENVGRTLTHVAVARSLVRVGVYKPGEAMTFTLQSGRQKSYAAKGGQHVVMFAQEDGQGTISSVAAGAVEAVFPQTASTRDVH